MRQLTAVPPRPPEDSSWGPLAPAWLSSFWKEARLALGEAPRRTAVAPGGVGSSRHRLPVGASQRCPGGAVLP